MDGQGGNWFNFLEQDNPPRPHHTKRHGENIDNRSQEWSTQGSASTSTSGDVFDELQNNQEDDDEDFVPTSPKKRRGRPKSVTSNNNWEQGQGEDDKTCKVCGKTFTAASSLRRHEITHTEKKQQFECDICHTKFTQKPSLMTHMKRQHLGELNFPCPHCEKKYVRNVELKEHIASAHRSLIASDSSKIEKWNCNICTRIYESKISLDIHMRYHRRLEKGKATDQTDHRCPTCEKVYNTAEILKKHMKSHTTERPFECPHCPKRFRLRYFLGQHIRGLHLAVRKYISKFCGREFATSNKRDIHDKLHQIKGICKPCRDRKIYACDLCMESAKSEYLLDLHKKEKHPEIKLELGRILEKDIFKKEENGLRMVRIDKGGHEGNLMESWHICMKCGRAHKDENVAKLHNETCEIPVPNLTMVEEEDELEPELPEEIEIEVKPRSEKLARPKSVKQKSMSLKMSKAKKLEKKFSNPENKLDTVFRKEIEIKIEPNASNSVDCDSRKTSNSIRNSSTSKHKSHRKDHDINKIKNKQKNKKVNSRKPKLNLNPEFVEVSGVSGGLESPKLIFLDEIECKEEQPVNLESGGDTNEDEWLNFNIDRFEDFEDVILPSHPHAQDPLQIEGSCVKSNQSKPLYRYSLLPIPIPIEFTEMKLNVQKVVPLRTELKSSSKQIVVKMTEGNSQITTTTETSKNAKKNTTTYNATSEVPTPTSLSDSKEKVKDRTIL